ncbi:MAG: YidC/Oxa1 family membrane protein insertase [Bacilli bacterium]|nr:YidC/Oxa1 family membrane protein insertase [Bacilli bacterium]
MNNKIKKSLIIALVGSLLLTGCTKTMVDDNKKAIINEQTGQNLTSNIICLPEEQSLLELYQKNESHMTVDLENLNSCSKMKIYEKKAYDGLWVQLFVRPLAWIIIKVGKLVNNYGISVMLIGLLIRLILLPFSAKTAKQSQAMKELQPKLQRIEKKYAGKDDQESLMKKSQETMMIYKEANVNPMSSCLVSFIQLPLFFAFLEAINRVPAIFENDLWVFQLGTTPMFGITHGNYWYVLLIVLIVLFTALTFMLSMGSMNSGNPEQEKQQKYMMLFMIVFIGIASVQLPAAIGLYWIVTNAFGVIQTAIIKKRSGEGK